MRREAAKAQFEKAEKQQLALEARPEADRSLKEYAALVSAYHRVALMTPRAAEVPAALNHEAGLYRAMGDLFHEKYYQQAVNTYQFLLREYPGNRYREDAQLAIAQIEAEDLQDPARARSNYEEFLAQHPRSPHAKEVRAALARLEAASPEAESAANPSGPRGRPAMKTEAAEHPPAEVKSDSPATSDKTGNLPSEITRIRTWNADTYTRVVIDVGTEVTYRAARISGPDRIYFDIENAKIGAPLLRQPVVVESGGFLKGVRVAQNQADTVRIVLEVDQVKDYSAYLLPDPYRLIVDVYGSSAGAEQEARANLPAPGPVTDAPPVKPEISATKGTPAKPAERTPEMPVAKPPLISSTQVAAPRSNRESAMAAAATPRVEAKATADASQPAAVKKHPRAAESAHDQAAAMGPASAPEPTRDGQQSLTRALGLKIGRIVIDPGHGGHDTGTIGPTGLMEKDLCLDVALRIGKLIRQRLPGAEVVYTRDDDTFVPLEQRTAIANQAKADLFLSIHANSSTDRSARGIETYYLNFTASSDAMEVAARENALSENSVHNLQDLVSKIARNEKIEESRDLAATIQDSLARRVGNINRGDRSRGVRKAPFVVLIGADMPSVLSEISFISNPSDEQWLKRPDNRQRVAEGLYRGIETYLQSTNSLTFSQNHPAPGIRSGLVARSGNQR